MKIILSSKAKFNLMSIYDYISKDNRLSAQKVLDKIYSVIHLIEKNPYIGMKGRVRQTREFFISDISYFIVYRIKENTLEIVTILHTSRKY